LSLRQRGAIAAFESAASLEPDNAAHWLALGQVQMGREDAVAALRVFNVVLSLHSDEIVALIESLDASQTVGNERASNSKNSEITSWNRLKGVERRHRFSG
jgi:cytochrome c-type biogenesis protein CcmH/NrfG